MGTRHVPPLRAIPALALLAAVVAGCQRLVAPRSADDGRVLRIGYQKGGALNLLRLHGDLERRLAPEGVTVQWLNFPAGPQTLEALGAGSVDLSAMGDAPLVFAQAAGVPVVYVANTPPGDASGRAILVPPGSPIKTVADLRGRRIAVQKGSGTHNFLVQALQKAGVPYSAVTVLYLAPTEARAAFDSGSIDAWAIWDPFLTVAEQQSKARPLIDGRGTRTAGGFYVSSRSFAVAHPAWIRAALEEVDRTAVWIESHPRESARQLSADLHVSEAVLERIQRRAPRGSERVGFRPIDNAVLDTQQEVADNFFKIGLLPKRVDVRAAALTPAQYAALTPPAFRPPAATPESIAKVPATAGKE